LFVSQEHPPGRTGAPGISLPKDGEAADAAVVFDANGKELGSAPKSRKKQSAVWNFFGPRYTSAKDGRVCVKCKLCEEEFAYVNTTNMYNHLVRKHKADVLQDLLSGKNVSASIRLSCRVYPSGKYAIALVIKTSPFNVMRRSKSLQF
jgi:hypothetical protein